MDFNCDSEIPERPITNYTKGIVNTGTTPERCLCENTLDTSDMNRKVRIIDA